MNFDRKPTALPYKRNANERNAYELRQMSAVLS